MELLFASGNKDKLIEVREMLGNDLIKMPKDVGINDFDVVEDGKTLEENAYKKAHALYELTGKPVFADDTGLFVDSLDMRPGIYSHRYAGENATYLDNRNKLLDELKDKSSRKACFKTVIAFIDSSANCHYFEGILNGEITKEEKGVGDFGYDKIFLADGFSKTLAEMSVHEKNQISHRAKAMQKFKDFLGEIWRF